MKVTFMTYFNVTKSNGSLKLFTCILTMVPKCHWFISIYHSYNKLNVQTKMDKHFAMLKKSYLNLLKILHQYQYDYGFKLHINIQQKKDGLNI